MIRIFIALKIPEDIQIKILNYCSDVIENATRYRWETKEKIHLTLKFIGDIKDEILPEIVDELNFVKRYSSFNCTISRFEFFFRDDEAKILWCNLDSKESISGLVQELNDRLMKFNIESEKRKFKGHLTLLRIKNKVDDKFIKIFNEYKFDPIQFNADQVALVQSILKPTGSEYKVLKNYELK